MASSYESHPRDTLLHICLDRRRRYTTPWTDFDKLVPGEAAATCVTSLEARATMRRMPAVGRRLTSRKRRALHGFGLFLLSGPPAAEITPLQRIRHRSALLRRLQKRRDPPQSRIQVLSAGQQDAAR